MGKRNKKELLKGMSSLVYITFKLLQISELNSMSSNIDEATHGTCKAININICGNLLCSFPL
jgi:hypothetical protein